MGALTIAFDITIVGALALPWVVLVLHLLFFEGENRLGDVLRWIKDQQQPAAAGVLLFAVAYTMGSAVSRIALDFFNDDDLFVHVHRYLFRVGMTENRILTSVYCKRDDSALLLAGSGNPALKEKIDAFQRQKRSGCGNDDDARSPADKQNPAPKKAIRSYLSANPNCLCQQSLSWHVRPGINSDDDDFNDAAADIFGLEESALLLKGDEYTQRLRQLHDQVMVLRGAAFNGLIAASFCLFAWGVSLRREKPRSAMRWLLAVVPVAFLLVGANSFRHHFRERSPSDPPYMEFSLLLIGLAGAWLLWMPRSQSSDATKPQALSSRRWAVLAALSAVLTVIATLGWWATEVAYAQEVIYSYDSQWTTTPPAQSGNSGF